MKRYKSYAFFIEYITSDGWKHIRESALKEDNYTCRTCGSKDDLDVHHKTYERLGSEKPEDLITLCHNCYTYGMV